VDEQKSGSQFSPEVQKRALSKAETQMSLLDFLNDDQKRRHLRLNVKAAKKWYSLHALATIR